MKTATEVSADNPALMRNIRRRERALAGICRALLAVEYRLGMELSDEGLVRVTLDDNIIADTIAEKRQDMDEVAAGLLKPWECRARWYSEDEATARRRGAVAGFGSLGDPVRRSRARDGSAGAQGRRRGGFRAVRTTERRQVGCGRPSTGSGWWWGVALRIVAWRCAALLVLSR